MNTKSEENNENGSHNITEEGEYKEMENGETSPPFLSVAVSRVTAVGYQLVPTFQKKTPPKKCYPKVPVPWNPRNIPLVSNEFFRSKTVVEITGCNSSTISKSIFDSNRTRSVHAVYDGAIAHCKTSSYMKFTIRLMRASKNNEIILLDVRRRTGSSIEFRDEYQAIVRTAVYGEEIPSNIPRNMPSSMKDIKCMQDNFIPLKEGLIECNLDNSIVHLASKMYDAHVITLQNLSSMTNPASKETSSKACKLILETHTQIFEYVLQDIMKQVENSNICGDDSEEYLRSLTLNILANVLSSEQNNRNIVLFVQQNQWTGSVFDSLVWYVTMAKISPWNACLAAKCIRLLIPTFRKDIYQTIATVALKNAEEFGITSYKLLEKETQAALAVMHG